MKHGITHQGRPGHLLLENPAMELLLSTSYGPRVVRCAPRGGPNLFAELPPTAETGRPTPFGEPWNAYGGHRLWHAPEDPVRTYVPDNAPLTVHERGSSVLLVQEIEPFTQLRKSIEVTLDPARPVATLVHRIENCGAFAVQLAPWALTMMAPGGVALFPLPPFRPFPEALLPATPLVLWPYTRLSDPRFTFGERLIQLRQDPDREEPQKLGYHDAAGWMAYRLGDALFVKRFDPRPGLHADLGCNAEGFTDGSMLELETLGPLASIAPGEAVLHEERWTALAGVDFGEGEAGAWDAAQRALAA